MEPARSFVRENLVPVHVARLQLGDCGVAAVGAASRRTYTEAAFGEIQSVAHAAADAVILHPFDVVEIDSALQHQVFDQTPHRIVGQGRHYSGLHPKRTPQAARDVVLAAAFPGSKMPRRADAHVAWIEAKHHFAQADQIPAAPFFAANLHAVSLCRADSTDDATFSEGESVAPGFTKSQASAPSPAMVAATRKPVLHPNRSPSQGVTNAVSAPPIWLAMFMKPESPPADLPPRSADTAQNALCER